MTQQELMDLADTVLQLAADTLDSAQSDPDVNPVTLARGMVELASELRATWTGRTMWPLAADDTDECDPEPVAQAGVMRDVPPGSCDGFMG